VRGKKWKYKGKLTLYVQSDLTIGLPLVPKMVYYKDLNNEISLMQLPQDVP